MNPWSGRAAAILLTALAAAVIIEGLIPALSRIDSDFPGYYTSARMVRDGVPTDKLYDDAWFRTQVGRYGLPAAPAKFAPFPPPTALLLVPVAGLAPLAALRVVTVVSALCLLVSIVLLARVTSWTRVGSALFLLSSYHAIVNGLRFGQPYILIATFCIVGYYAYLKGRPGWAGVCWGLFAPIKYFPVVILAYLGTRKEWRVLWSGAATIAGVGLLSVAVLGWEVHGVFLLSVLPAHLTGRLSLEHTGLPFTAVYQSFDTLFDRLFVFDPAANPRPWMAVPFLRVTCMTITKVSIALAAVAALVKLAREDGAGAVAPSIGILGLVVLLIAPGTATYHFVLEWLPIALLINHFLSRGARVPAYAMVGLYVLIGFAPYKLLYRFEGRGGLTVLAYPRLWLLLAMFIICICYVLRPRLAASESAVVA